MGKEDMSHNIFYGSHANTHGYLGRAGTAIGFPRAPAQVTLLAVCYVLWPTLACATERAEASSTVITFASSTRPDSRQTAGRAVQRAYPAPIVPPRRASAGRGQGPNRKGHFRDPPAASFRIADDEVPTNPVATDDIKPRLPVSVDTPPKLESKAAEAPEPEDGQPIFRFSVCVPAKRGSGGLEVTEAKITKVTGHRITPVSAGPQATEQETEPDDGPIEPPKSAPGDPDMGVGSSELVRKPIVALTTDISPSQGDFPPDKAAAVLSGKGELPAGPVRSRSWRDYLYQWEAPALCHRPLYFEQINLERHGYSISRFRVGQSALAGAHFFGTAPALPYKMVVEPPGHCIFTLGHYRPGSCVPYQIHWPPLKPSAAAAEAAVVAGLILALP